MRSILFATTLMVLSALLLSAQQMMPLEHINLEKGLDQNTVKTLEEDGFGRIWIGTQLGLQYWDGKNLKRCDAVKESVLSLHYREDLSAMYCITIQRAYRIDVLTGQVRTLAFGLSDYYSCGFFDDHIVLMPTLSGNNDYALVIDYQLNVLKKGVEAIAEVEGLASEGDSIAFGQHTLVIKGDMKLFLDSDLNPVLEGYMSHGITYKERQAFVVTHQGLVRFQEESGRVKRSVLLPRERIETVLVDRNNNLWVGTSGNGVYMYHHNSLAGRFWSLNDRQGEALSCWGFLQTDDALYVATSQGMMNLNSEVGQALDEVEKVTEGLHCFTAIAADDFILLGTATDGIMRLRNGQMERVYYNASEVLDNTTLQFLENDQGLLALTKRGFVQFDPEGGLLFSKPLNHGEEKSYCMHARANEQGYFAASTTKVIQFDSELEQMESYDDHGARVFSMLVPDDEQWWITSMDGGLFRFKDGELESVDVGEEKLLALAHLNDEVWITAFDRVIQYNNELSIPYTRENGFPIREYDQLGIIAVDDHSLFVSGIRGVFRFDPQALPTSIALPTWLVQTDSAFLNPDTILMLNYEQSQVVLSASCPMLADQNRFALAYQQDSTWQPWENHDQRAFQVSYGTSSLLFRARNEITGEERLHRIRFQRDLPFWLTTWFKALLVLGGVMVFIALYFLVKYLRTRTLLKAESEARKVSQERLRISRELHDNIGARLTHIISSLDVELHQQEQPSSRIEKINAFARETMGQLRETIWATGDKSIYFSEFARRVELYLSQADALTPIELRFENTSEVDFELQALQTINHYRVMQEAVNNAIKYSEAASIEVKLYQQADAQYLVIKDDGKGFDAENPAAGTGLEGMKQRVQEAGGQWSLESQSGKGTVITVVFNIGM